MEDKGIVRHRKKIESTVNNARMAQALRAEFGSLAAYFWAHEPGPKDRLIAPFMKSWSSWGRRKFQGHFRGPEKTWLVLCRPNHGLCLHAGHGYGQRPYRGLLLPCRGGRSTRPVRPASNGREMTSLLLEQEAQGEIDIEKRSYIYHERENNGCYD